ncbi:MAG: hypothetical protein ACJ8CB_03895 [Ktedonobacteraceae bacterium]
MESMSLDELRVVKREMAEVGREAQQVMHPLEVAGVLISLYRGASLDIERRALSYALLLLERSACPGSWEAVL